MNPHKDECDCSCHRDPSCTHFIPCCLICEFCGLNIKVGHVERHREHCRELSIRGPRG